ncbi:hypothetical protein [Spirillospora sp. NPDC048819]|uniref:MinD/ParA family ATP-binding protein n=1 Tax=Spirillospora sp. NPDC048819 TaxID=3155268 RepID=UPI0033FAF437
MPDSNWQHSVLRDLGVSQRGLTAFGSAATVIADAGWGAEAAEHSARRPSPPPAVQEPLAAPPAPPVPQPVPTEAEQPRAYDPFPDPPQPAAAEAEQRQSQPYDPFPEVPQPNAPEPAQAGTAQAPAPPHAPEAPGPDPRPQPAPQQHPDPAPQQQFDPTPQQQADEAGVPLVNEDFSWEAAISPVGGSAPQAPGLPQAPGAGGENEEREHDAASAQHAPAAPVPAPPPQPHGAGAVPMADEFVRKNQHGDALVRRMGRGVRKAVGASGQIRTRAEIADYLRRPVGGFRQITVVSVRGGAGKTTVAALLATELARHRPDRVLAMDADAELGSLPLRLGVRSELSLFDLAAQQPRTFEEAAQYLQQTREGLWVLAATRGGRITGEFNFETFQAAFSAVSRYISTAVTDCSAGILTDLHRGILGQSHSVVLVTPGTVDGALSARGALEWFSQGAQRGLLARTVIAMVSHAPQVGTDLSRATQMLTAWGTPVVNVPYDRHIAMGSAVDLSRLGEATQAAVGRIAYEAFARSLGDAAPSH